jgi:hypothetical protein
MDTWIHGEMEKWTWNLDVLQKNKQKTENGRTGNFRSFSVRSSCKQKFVVRSFVDEETNGSYPFAKGVNRPNGLVHLCSSPTITVVVCGRNKEEEKKPFCVLFEGSFFSTFHVKYEKLHKNGKKVASCHVGLGWY